MNLRREMEEGFGDVVEGGEKQLVTRGGKQNLGFGVEKEGSVLCYAVWKFPKNYKQCALENKLKIDPFLISLSMILVLRIFSLVLKVILQDTRKFSSTL